MFNNNIKTTQNIHRSDRCFGHQKKKFNHLRILNSPNYKEKYIFQKSREKGKTNHQQSSRPIKNSSKDPSTFKQDQINAAQMHVEFKVLSKQKNGKSKNEHVKKKACKKIIHNVGSKEKNDHNKSKKPPIDLSSKNSSSKYNSSKSKSKSKTIKRVDSGRPNQEYYGADDKSISVFNIAGAQTEETFHGIEHNFFQRYSKLVKRIKSAENAQLKEYRHFKNSRDLKPSELLRLVKIHSLERSNLETKLMDLMKDSN